MNVLILNQPGGYPYSATALAEAQIAWNLFNNFGNLAGNLSIISGCEIDGSNVSNGSVFIDGELLEFRGGLIQSKVVIKEDITYRQFQDTNNKPVLKTRYATFGTGIAFHLWDDFERCYPTKELAAALAAKANASALESIIERLEGLEKKNAVFAAGGGMVMWRKPANQIPAGWAEVVDWRGRLPMGYDPEDNDFKPVGKTGGAKNKSLAIPEMPDHYHTVQINGNASGSGYFSFEAESGATEAFHDFETSSAGEGQAFSLLNPYRVVMFIEFIG